MEDGLFVLLSCHLSGNFLGTGILDFSGCWHGTKRHYHVVHDTARFSGKNFICLKLGKLAKSRP